MSSHPQGTIDWAKVAEDGIDFAIIRCGGRYYQSGTVFEDKQFRANIQGALWTLASRWASISSLRPPAPRRPGRMAQFVPGHHPGL